MNGAAPRLALEHALVLLIVVWSVVEARWLYPALVRRVHEAGAGARLRLYRVLVVPLWAATALIAAMWWVESRPWSWLRIDAGSGWQPAIGAAIAAITVGFLVLQQRAIAGRPAMQKVVEQKLQSAEAMMPRTPAEYRMWVFVSFSAGLCEEVIFRGWLVWYAAAWMRPPAAVLASTLLFMLGHTYLGRRHALMSGLLGLALAGIVIASGSLWPAVVVHMALDWNSGALAYRYLDRPEV